ncbi:MAG: RNA polymerase sigma factor [Pseudonocardia sp.]
MTDDVSPVVSLVAAAATGDETAWSEIVYRYSPLLVGVVRQYRLTAAQTEDVAQTVWLRLVEHLDRLRAAQALPMWIITTGRREALRQLAAERRVQPRDPSTSEWADAPGQHPAPDDELLRVERHEALLAGLAELDGRQRELMLLLIEDPPPSYAEISRRTGIPVGAIGPTRARAIDRLRRTPLLKAYGSGEPDRRLPVVKG